MTTEIKVSNCCGDRLITINDNESTGHYECFACKKACDGVSDCADCFPQHYPEEEYKNQTVPICEKHANEMYKKTPDTKPAIQKSLTTETNVTHERNTDIPRTNDDYAKLIGGIILNVGNIYNENKQDITVRVAEYIYKEYIK